jgi:hypothetical protein
MIALFKSVWADPRVQTAVKGLIVALTGAVVERIFSIIDALGGVAPV